jgi:uncharacterized membrane protein
MTGIASRWSDRPLERLVGLLLQGGVLAAAAMVLVGAILLLVQHGVERVDFRVFHGTPAALRSLTSILRGAAHLDSRAVVQLGLLLLIATPVARVALTLVAFVVQRDRLYVVLTAIVLALLAFALFFGGV